MQPGNQADKASLEYLARRVATWRGSVCGECGRVLCGHELLFSIASGAASPRCLDCLAGGTALTAEQTRDHLRAHFRQRSCYEEAWRQESEREGYAAASLPGCLWPTAEAHDSDAKSRRADPSRERTEPEEKASALAEDDAWDAGGMACGELILELRRRMNALRAQGVLKLTALDHGAREDIPAWCRMTGHLLIRQRHPEYWLQRK